MGRRVSGPQSAVAPAGNRFEPFSIQHLDPTTVLADQACPLEVARNHRDSRSLDAQHLRQVLLGQWNFVGSGTVMDAEQPAGQTGFSVV